jgi:hypothetical protein
MNAAAQYLKSKLGGKVAIGAKVTQVQEIFMKKYNMVGFLPACFASLLALLQLFVLCFRTEFCHGRFAV